MTDIIGPLYHEHDVVTDNRFIQRGYVVAPEGAGLGVTLDEAAVREYRMLIGNGSDERYVVLAEFERGARAARWCARR
jgi:hypothetical protein